MEKLFAKYSKAFYSLSPMLVVVLEPNSIYGLELKYTINVPY